MDVSDKDASADSSDDRGLVRAQIQAHKKAEKQQEDNKQVHAGRSQRTAKTNALAKAPWFEAEHKKRPPGKLAPKNELKRKRGAATLKKMANLSGVDQSELDEGHTTKHLKKATVTKASAKVRAPPTVSQKARPKVNKADSNESEQESTPEFNTDTHSHSDSSRDSDTDADGNDDEEPASDDEDADGEDYAEDEDEDWDLIGMADQELGDRFTSEVPQMVSSYAPRDTNSKPLATVTQSQSHPRRQSTPTPGPPKAESQGRTPARHLSSAQRPDGRRSPAPGDRKKKAGKSTKREQVFQDERPEVKRQGSSGDDTRYLDAKGRRKKSHAAPLLSSSAVCPTADKSTTHVPSDNESAEDDSWPSHAQLRGHNLKTQHILIRQLCRDAIKIVHTTLVTTHAWPELNRLSEYRRDVLTRAAKSLQKTDVKYADLRARIKKDEKFTMILGKLVMDCLATVRGPARLRGLDHIAVFQLGVGDMCIERVQALVANDTYIYPGKWSVDDHGKPFWVIKSKELYLNPGLIEVLRSAFFSTTTAFGYKFKAHYKSSHPTRLEPELTASLVALAATGLYAGLHAWQSGLKVDNEKFEGDTFKTVFERHLDYLQSVKDTNAIAYHVLMNILYSKVINSNTSGENNKKQGSALAVADLSAFV